LQISVGTMNSYTKSFKRCGASSTSSNLMASHEQRLFLSTTRCLYNQMAKYMALRMGRCIPVIVDRRERQRNNPVPYLR
jgi:hypothetical protein